VPVSTPEWTGLDLIRFSRHAGGMDSGTEAGFVSDHRRHNRKLEKTMFVLLLVLRGESQFKFHRAELPSVVQ